MIMCSEKNVPSREQDCSTRLKPWSAVQQKAACLVIAAVFAAAAAAISGPALTSFFVSDDFILIEAVSKGGPFGILFQSQGGFFRPLTGISFYLDYRSWSLDPFGYHLTNLVLHGLNSILLVVVAFLLLSLHPDRGGKRYLISFLSGLLFLFWPSHSEAIYWISSRPDILALFFFLMSYAFYLKSSQAGNRAWLILSLVSFGAALLSKESVLFYPALIMLHELYTHYCNGNVKQNLGKSLAVFSCFVVVELVYLLVRKGAIGTLIGGYGQDVHLSFSFVQVLKNVLSFCSRTLLPPMPDKIMTPLLFILLVLVVTFSGYVYVRRYNRKFPELVFYLVFSFFLSILPVISLGVSKTDSQGERYLYLPSIFYIILVVLLIDYFLRGKVKVLSSGLVIVILSGFFLFQEARNWNEAGSVSRTLIDDLVARDSEQQISIVNLPDNLKGAYILRNGLKPALVLFSGQATPPVITVFGWQTLLTHQDEIRINRVEQGYSLELEKPGQHFNSPLPGKSLSLKNYQMKIVAKNKAWLWFSAKTDEQSVLVYSGGIFRTLNEIIPEKCENRHQSTNSIR